ncbi:hypothetical protein CPB84DRAFT_1743221 [Gymnopilus junonius]|uniref:Uncharacterized protein n=1 Tax=Gymnopilus junonius TaxID=109634 RepID=A0A9P5P130_GYMJU|nr:hypothetical protein CPB84DRAFT_1743221 [Gymnopilus junonius]
MDIAGGSSGIHLVHGLGGKYGGKMGRTVEGCCCFFSPMDTSGRDRYWTLFRVAWIDSVKGFRVIWLAGNGRDMSGYSEWGGRWLTQDLGSGWFLGGDRRGRPRWLADELCGMWLRRKALGEGAQQEQGRSQVSSGQGGCELGGLAKGVHEASEIVYRGCCGMRALVIWLQEGWEGVFWEGMMSEGDGLEVLEELGESKRRRGSLRRSYLTDEILGEQPVVGAVKITDEHAHRRRGPSAVTFLSALRESPRFSQLS